MMKKIALVVFCFFIALAVSAQGKYALDVNHKYLDGTLTGGVKVAMNLPHFCFGKLPHGMRNGGQAGLWVEYKPRAEKFRNWSILAETVFSSEGGKFTINQALAHLLSKDVQLRGMAENVNQDIIVTENYIKIPVLVRYRFAKYFSAEAGPELGFNVYSKARVDGVDYDLGLGSRTHWFSAGVGAGATYYLTDYMQFNVRYSIGLTRTFKDVDDHQGNVQIGAAFLF